MAKIDKLNELKKETTPRSMPYDKFFGEMDLTDEEKEKRGKLAREIELLFLYIFLYIASEDNPDVDYCKNYIMTNYRTLAYSFIGSEKEIAYIEDYISKIADETIETTLSNLDELYYMSQDRAMYIAENEANSIGNYKEYVRAIKSGYKYKEWHTMMDSKVRHTHKEANGQKVEIMKPFRVGFSNMAYPRDTSYNADAREIINCRCVCKYSK